MASKNGRTIAEDDDCDEETPMISQSATSQNDGNNWWSSLTFGWFTPVLVNIQSKLDKGQSPDLEEDEGIPPQPPEDCTSEVNRKFQALWAAELMIDPKSPSLKRALWKASARPFLFATGLSAISSAAQFVGPAFLKLIIPYLLESSPSLGYGLGLTAALLLAGLTENLCARHAAYLCMRVGLRARTALMVAVFQKALKIDATYYQDHPTGQVTNLMSEDCNRIAGFIEYMILLLSLPFQIGLSLVGLWFLLGYSCLGGVLVIVMSVPLATRTAQWMGTFNKKLMKLKDERINCNQETILNMKIVKFQVWEQSFRERVEDFRKAEVGQLFKYKAAQSVAGILADATPMLVSLLTFGLYVTIQGQVLLAGTALSALGLFNILKAPIAILPHVLNFAVECNIAVERIRHFLMAPDYEPPLRLTNGENDQTNGRVCVINLRNATFSYQRIQAKAYKDKEPSSQDQEEDIEQELLLTKADLVDTEEQVAESGGRTHAQYGSTNAEGPGVENDAVKKQLPLRRVDFECNEGEFIALVGGVGSGKSTFFKALLGEVQKVSGEVRVHGDVAYFDQHPFIMNDTLKGNILFGRAGEKVDDDLYRLAVKASCLEYDFNLLPAGDQTEIGEQGTNLSGGQKARVAIGRAVYQDADISLLDDCLSAVDAHVGRDLFEKCIIDVLLKSNSGARRKKTVILATNALQYLSHPMLDRIVVFEDGRVVESGPYNDLVNRENSQFKSLLTSFNESHANENDSETREDEEEEGEDTFCEESLDARLSDPFKLAEVSQDSSTQPLHRPKFLIRTFSAPIQSPSVFPTDTSIRSLPTRGYSYSVDCSIPSRGEDYIDNKLVDKKIVDPFEFAEESRNSFMQSLLIRSPSIRSSTSSTKDSDFGHPANIMTNEMEEGQVGRVDTGLYFLWAKAAGGLWAIIPLVLVFAAQRSTDVMATRWITIWGISKELAESIQLLYLRNLAFIYLAGVLVGVAKSIIPAIFGLKASNIFFSSLLGSMLAAPMAFYDTTPTGRILNRFSQDINTLDETLIGDFQGVVTCLFYVFAAIFLLLTASPWVVVALPCLMLFYKRQYDCYNQSNRELKRVNSARRSPIYHLFAEALNGYCTIRAFGAGDALLYRMCDIINQQQHATYLLKAGNNWISVRLAFVGTCLVTVGCFAFVITKYFDPESGLSFAKMAGMSLPYLLTVNGALTYLVQLASALEADMVSVERVQEYIELEKEAPQHTPADDLLEKEWPLKGLIEFKNVKMRYRPGCPLVLKGLNLKIPSKAKVGICGRTGCGKSTLMTVLMRLAELDEGEILVDGIDIKTIGLAKLRSNVAIIPQDPVLFAGTVQSNIDPFNQHTRERLMDVLGRVGLLGPINSVEDNVEQGGNNFSAGQRQLLVIARALLDDATVVFLDEATASIDGESDARVQKLFRTDFAGSTTLTVAHRLNTIMDSTHILVMSDGKAVEFDSPSALLSKDSIFKDLLNTWEKDHQ